MIPLASCQEVFVGLEKWICTAIYSRDYAAGWTLRGRPPLLRERRRQVASWAGVKTQRPSTRAGWIWRSARIWWTRWRLTWRAAAASAIKIQVSACARRIPAVYQPHAACVKRFQSAGGSCLLSSHRDTMTIQRLIDVSLSPQHARALSTVLQEQSESRAGPAWRRSAPAGMEHAFYHQAYRAFSSTCVSAFVRRVVSRLVHRYANQSLARAPRSDTGATG